MMQYVDCVYIYSAIIFIIFPISRLRQRFNSYPGRPQLLKFKSMSIKDDAESKLEKFSAILEADLLNLQALKELSWSGVPRKVKI